MKINEYNHFNFTGTQQYQLDDENFVVATREDSYFSDRNIIPIFYLTEDKQILGIDEDEIGKKIFVISTQRDTDTEEIATRFYMNELFKIFRGPFSHNERYDIDINRPRTKIYKNYLQPFQPNDLIEIFNGVIDYKKSRLLIEDEELREFLNKKYVRTPQVLFVEFADKIIGPFNLKGSDDEGYFLAAKSTLYKFGLYNFTEDYVIEFDVNRRARKIISDNAVIPKSYYADCDFISDRDLMEWFNTELTNSSEQLFNKRELDLLLKKIDKANTSIEQIESKERYDRIYQILASSKETWISKQNLLKALPEFQGINEEIKELEIRRLEIKNTIDARTKNLDKINNEISEKQNTLSEIQKKIEDLKSQTQEEQNKIRQQISKEIADLEKIKNDLDREIEQERNNKSETLTTLKKDIEFQERRKSELDLAIETLKREFTTEQRKAQEKLAELVKQNTHFNFISGRDLPNESEVNSKYENYCQNDTINNYIALRDTIGDIFKSHQRHFENHFIDNLLISIHQNTLTLFAGLPGTGKTSLAKMLTGALAPHSRVKEIPVARGWSSQKDLIGFANPLSKKFHESQTGLYTLLKQLDYEWNNKIYFDSPFSYVILDEANLSPLEHYWSIFYNSTDTHASDTKPLSINLGQSEILHHANTIRFIGTINYDQTTEELSPRILDRTNVIRLMPKQFQFDEFNSIESRIVKVSFKEMITMFQLNDFDNKAQHVELSDELLFKFKEIKEIFNTKLNIYISPRVENGIMRYCKLASTIMTENSRPLDYCIAQRLLPLINIQGDKKAELESLLSLISNFNLDNSVSVHILKNIINIGSRNGYTQDNFNYFLTLTHV